MEEDNEVEDNDKDDNAKGILAVGLDRDLGFLLGYQGHQGHLPH